MAKAKLVNYSLTLILKINSYISHLKIIIY